jgi:hypothetical protein
VTTGQTAEHAASKTSCVYIDSPMPNAVDQVLPFYRSGFFDRTSVPILLRRRMFMEKRHAPVAETGSLPPITKVSRFSPSRQLGSSQGVVFYPFAAQANAQLVSDRSVQHVLTLHGESNKTSSFRPSARLYDYVLVAGTLACRRYLRLNIFTEREVAQGRLIQMGDTLVQDMPYLQRAPISPDAWVLYAPTWETSLPSENYSSAENGYGFEIVQRCAEACSTRRVLIKPHPNYGMRDIAYIRQLVRSIQAMRALGFEVKVINEAVNYRIHLILTMMFGRGIYAETQTTYPVSMAVVDISGMEAICLKQHIPHIVIRKPSNVHMPDDADLTAVYRFKMLTFGEGSAAVEKLVETYAQAHAEVDIDHRRLVFAYADASLPARSAQERFAWLSRYLQDNTYWRP